MMGKIQRRQISKKEWRAIREELISCFQRLRRMDRGTFLLDVLTESEQIMLARRLRIARMLLLGATDREVRSELHVGFGTIRQIHRWLDAKVEDYQSTVVPVLIQAEKQGLQQKRIGKIPLNPMTLRGLRKRYPSHFAFLNLLLGDPDIYVYEREDRLT